MQATNQTFQKMYNRALVLRHVRRNERISRVDLSRALGLKKSSISNIVAELLEAGIISEREQGESSASGGRKPIFLEVNRQFCGFLGIEVQPNRYNAVFLDLAGRVLFQREGKVSTYRDGFEPSLEKIYEELAPLAEQTGLPVAGICLGVPGYVHPADGTILYSIPHGLENWRVSPRAQPWDVPVYVENDANCCAWGELMVHPNSGAVDFLSVLMEFQEENPRLQQDIGISTGFGVVINGSLYYGQAFNSGEFKSALWTRNNKSQVGIPDEQLLGIRENQDILDDYLTELLMNLSPIVSVMSPQRVVLCGDGRNLLPRISYLLESRLSDRFIGLAAQRGLFQPSIHAQHNVAIGAAGRLLETLFDQPRIGRSRYEMGVDWEYVLDRFSVPGSELV
ncbi:ROK family transcriptional regulator [Spirochaeta lutea]|uniref:HTH marR-type domain-containing protein n=1 Tax=Spirochaeta lutea TaxID=1480694 RepID=A0A098R1P6_9SPIO|nr:ROK family transcriptional regulator [Spirochaeta lutea]KGE73598.1 hypothetical protein DC28_02815 [Spirochaeta lutea]